MFVFAFEIENRLVEEINLFFAKYVPELLDPSVFVPPDAERLSYPVFGGVPAICWVTPITCLFATVLLYVNEFNKR